MMNRRTSLRSSISLSLTLFVALNKQHFANGESNKMEAYHAKISPLGNNASVSGSAIVFTFGNDDSVMYGGMFDNLEPNLIASSDECAAFANGCGLHIHAGFGCENSETQGGHYWEGSDEDPWIEARYSSNAEGTAVVGNLLNIGSNNVDGRAMVVHAQDGSRIGCGLLTLIDDESSDLDLLTTSTAPLTSDGGVSGTVWTVVPKTSAADATVLCYAGHASGLQGGIESFLQNEASADCNVANGCGTHVHGGTSCDNATTQGGHWYSTDALESDPWALLGYLTTTSDGQAMYGTCVDVGFPASEAVDKPFIVHAEDGSRVACGMLEQAAENETATTTSNANRGHEKSIASVVFLFVAALFLVV